MILSKAPLGFQWPTLDPYLFCVHHVDLYPKGNEQMGPVASLEGRNIGQDFEPKDGWRMYHGDTVPGFPQHPHRGFETLTIARQGLIDHSDSLGATARFGGGDVQWLTAGKGIVHCEMFPLLNQKGPNTAELFQIWINLPAADKMVDPHFSMFWHPQIPKVYPLPKSKAVEVTVIAGGLMGVKPLAPPPHSWASRAESDMAVLSMVLQPGAEWTLPPARDSKTARVLYFFKGDALSVGGEWVRDHAAVQVRPDAPCSLKAGEEPVEILMLQGRPIGEAVAQHGPFVMNTRAEIEQAFRDYQRTHFGGWPWKRDDPVHAREQARFAKHADGRLEKAPT